MVDMSEYKQRVHRSLLQREMLGGVPQAGMFIIFILGMFFIYLLQLYVSIVPLVLFYFVMRHFSKKDPWSVDILIENIKQKDKYV